MVMSSEFESLTTFFEVKNGYAFTSKEQSQIQEDGFLEILKQGHIELGGGLRKHPKRFYVRFNSGLERYLLRKGDIVMAMTDMKNKVVILGVPALVDKDKTYLLNQRVGWLKPKEGVVSKFFYYQMLDRTFLETLRSKANSGVQVNLSTSAIKEMEFWAPPLKEQKAIAEVLSSLDDKIELLQKQNETLEALAQTLFRQWFIEEADDRWEEAFLSDEFNLTMGQSPPGTSYNESALGTPMFQGNADFSFRFPVERVFTTEPKRLAKKYDTLISVRAPVGAQNMAFESCCIGRGVAAIRHPKGYFSYTYYKVNSIMRQISAFNDTGTVFGSISKKDLERISISIPPAELIEKFEEVGGSLEIKIHHNEESINNLKMTRDTLLPKLMSGQVRVKLD